MFNCHTSLQGFKLALAAFLVGAAAPSIAADDGAMKRHLPGVFMGVTSGGGETDYTIGLEYEYRATQMLGFGVIAEHTPDRHSGDGVSVALGALHVHPLGDWRLTAAYGWEDVHDASVKIAKGKKPTKNEDVFRLGAAYDFHVGQFGLAPSLNVDFVGGKEVAVFGISVVRPF
jgi:hypothetical protein